MASNEIRNSEISPVVLNTEDPWTKHTAANGQSYYLNTKTRVNMFSVREIRFWDLAILQKSFALIIIGKKIDEFLINLALN